MTNFYVLKPSGGKLFGTNWTYGEQAEPVKYGAADECPQCHGPVTMRKWLPPHFLRLSSAHPQRWGDLIWGTMSPFVVSSRFKQAYKTKGLEGVVRFGPACKIVRLGNRKPQDLLVPLPEYHLVTIYWNGANLDDARSGALRTEVTCSFDRDSVRKLERIVLEPNSWQGADLFGVRGLPGLTLATDKFKRMVDDYSITNVMLIPIEKYGYDEDRPGGWFIQG